jgi:SAM-dependent methyltransferase
MGLRHVSEPVGAASRPAKAPLTCTPMVAAPLSMLGDDAWWESHWESAPDEICQFLAEDGIQVTGASIADFGCGDGIMAGALASRVGASVVGFDLYATDSAALHTEAKSRGHDLSSLPLEFRTIVQGVVDARDEEFDVALSWSAMEHVFDRVGYMREAHRVIRPYGHFFIQVWPMWHSEHGHHLWQWLQPFDHLRYSRDEVVERLRTLDRLPAPLEIDGRQAQTLNEYLGALGMDHDKWLAQAIASYDSCNRITIDEIQTLLLEHGFGIGRVELMTGQFHVPADLQSVPLSRLSPSGFKLTAWRRP